MPEQLGHLSRQLNEVRDRISVSAVRFEIGNIDFLIGEFHRLERIVNALESIGVNLDEEDIGALEGMQSDHGFWSDGAKLSRAINDAIGDHQTCAREYEQESAIEALARAGFVVDDEGETWTRSEGETVTIELVNGRESRYKWEYESGPADDFPPLNSLTLIRCASGVSGEFHRLLVLIGAGGSEGAATGPETPKPMELKNDDYCPSCGTGGPDGCPLCGRIVTQEGDVTITTTRDMLPGEFDSEVPVSTDERFTRVVK